MGALTTLSRDVDTLSLVETLGARIREARLEKRWTQRRLADAAGFDSQAVSDYERERHQPSLQRLEAIAQALGKPLSFFVDEPAAQQELRDELREIRLLVEDLRARLLPPEDSP